MWPAADGRPAIATDFLEVGELRCVRLARAGISVRRLHLQTVAEIVRDEGSGKQAQGQEKSETELQNDLAS